MHNHRISYVSGSLDVDATSLTIGGGVLETASSAAPAGLREKAACSPCICVRGNGAMEATHISLLVPNQVQSSCVSGTLWQKQYLRKPALLLRPSGRPPCSML